MRNCVHADLCVCAGMRHRNYCSRDGRKLQGKPRTHAERGKHLWPIAWSGQGKRKTWKNRKTQKDSKTRLKYFEDEKTRASLRGFLFFNNPKRSWSSLVA